ncbi:voltage-dependent calcium channel alpha-2/delta-4 [Fistulifera solaris]|uniref:Voltage-dependent calcium channel alpha-2/delta-4 n=1 Tax=Fistulifera solaris TaxID=1519565 RepID=A0A1Z5KJR5_FISSO|nr:voltage-dependent calcium channel alpha-2/delta-4 [Fistulifera solaris]|eukprot:GAX26355.1 voltage-dependent calcium channel alpha-2/delta-4 [Fistulifera solaris]
MRCNETSLKECQSSNYDECFAALPSPTCPSGPEFNIPSCGSGEGCPGYVDFTTSVYSIAPGTAETDPLVYETICWTRHMNEWLIQRNERDRAFWEDLGINPGAMYFGSTTGVFRYYPGRRTKDCGTYDPRPRPWNVAPSSGPKNIVLVLDKSGSMKENRMTLMKKAAIRVIETLTMSDRIAIVVFDETARVIADEGMYLYPANNESKAILIDAIANLEAKGETNFYDAFEKAFDVLDISKGEELTVNCNSALLFLTDGEMTHPVGITPETVIDLVTRRVNATSTKMGKPVLFFSYSISEEEDVHTLPKKLACPLPLGVWSRINREDQIVEALSSYYQLFSLGLGDDENADFVSWVEPYIFVTGGHRGTTIAAPVYDRSTSPPMKIGVVGRDIVFKVLTEALETDNVTEAVAELARYSVAVCPATNLPRCVIEEYRKAFGGDEARCFPDECNADAFSSIVPEKCFDSSKYTGNLSANSDNKGRSYADIVCCGSNNGVCLGGETEGGLTKAMIIGIAVGGGGVIIVALLMLYCCRKRSGNNNRRVVVVNDAIAVPVNPPPIAPSAPTWKSSP